MTTCLLVGAAWIFVTTNTVVNIPINCPSAIEFVIGRTEKPNLFTRTWAGGVRDVFGMSVQPEIVNKKPYSDAALDLWAWWDGHGGRCYVRPSIGPYMESGGKILPKGEEMLKGWDALPSPYEHVFRLDFTPISNGVVAAWVNGSYAQEMRWHKNPSAALETMNYTFRPGSRYRLVPCQIDLASDTLALPFPEPEPVAKCHYVAGNSCFECEAYQSRYPMGAFPLAIHRRVPATDWHRARIRFAIDDDPKLEKVLTVRLCHNQKSGSGGNLISDVDLDFTKGIPESVRTVGTTFWKGKEVPLYEMDVNLNLGPIADLIGWKDYLDFEFLGRKRTEDDGPDRRMKPAHDSSSAFVICGVDLVKAPFNAVIRPLPSSPGNVFTADEKVKRTAVTLTAWRDCEGEVICPYDRIAFKLHRGETKRFELDLSSVTDEGLYELPIMFRSASGETYFTHSARMAVVPSSKRVVEKTKSSYGTWWFNWDYYLRYDIGAPLCRKAGIPKVTVTDGKCRTLMETNGLISCGNVRILGPGYFDYDTGKFKSRDGLDGEAYVVRELQRWIDGATFVDHILVWHESAAVYSNLPEELTGQPIPAVTDWDKKRARYLDECVRILRKHFPQYRIQIGNTGISLGAVVCPLRGGTNPENYRGAVIGNEAFGGMCPPERLSMGNIQGMAVVKATAHKMLGFDVPMDGCWEATCRSSRNLGEEKQAAYYVRDALIGLANGYRLTMLGGIADCHNGYFDSHWGGGGLCYRAPNFYPKRTYLEVARLTAAVDGGTEPIVVETDDPSVYACTYKRADGRYVTAFWANRGTFSVKLGWFRKLRGGEIPVYEVTDEPIRTANIVERCYPDARASSARAVVAEKLDSAAKLSLAPSPAFKTTKWNRLPILVPGTFTLSEVWDEERGKCLELKLDMTVPAPCPFLTEYTTLAFKESVALPGSPRGLGLWVKGNANGGQVRFEIEDGKQRIFRTFDYGNTTYEGLDAEGRLCVDFAGWRYLDFGIDGKNWYTMSGDKSAPVPPYRLKAITVGMNRNRYGLIDFIPVANTIRLQCVGALE